MFFGVTGCPRCPVTVAAAVGAAVHRCGQWWGPPSFLTGANTALQKAATWLRERAETTVARLEKRARTCRAGLQRQDGCISDVAYDA
eukprot:11568239-Alexandrium_andersonii.AAC.1